MDEFDIEDRRATRTEVLPPVVIDHLRGAVISLVVRFVSSYSDRVELFSEISELKSSRTDWLLWDVPGLRGDKRSAVDLCC